MNFIYIFDLDNTIYGKLEKFNYDKIQCDHKLIIMLDNIPNNKYIFTNGTYEHAVKVLKIMNIYDKFKKIFARDTITYMKPNIMSYIHVQNNIIDLEKNYIKDISKLRFIFFDDLLENLIPARSLKWKTVLISDYPVNNYDIEDFHDIEYVFVNINNALSYFYNLNNYIMNINHNSLI
jgi:FMN phosphatase YigB (HAD superfamily)